MKKYRWLFALPVIILYFVIIFSLTSGQVRKWDEEITQIHHLVKSVIGDYLKGQRISVVSFNSLPIYYDKNRCIVACRVESADESGANRWTEFDTLLWRENKTLKATIVRVDKHPSIPKVYKKTAPWDLIFKPAQKRR